MRLLAAFAGLFVIAACQAPPPPEPDFTGADRQAIATEIEGLVNESLARNRPEDADWQLEMWSPDADSYYVGEPALFSQSYNIVSTLEDVRAFFEPSRWNRQSTNITATNLSVAVLGPESAVSVLEGYFSVTSIDGETGPDRVMTQTGVWVKESGAWKIVHWHQSWNRDPIEEG